MDLTALITKELGIPKHYVKNYQSKKDKAFIIVHKKWLNLLLSNNEIPEFIYHDDLCADEIQALFYQKEKLQDWHILLIHLVCKPKDNEIVIPLFRERTNSSKNVPDFSFAQLLHYVSETNFKNMWKYFYKKYLFDEQSKSKSFIKGNLFKKNNDILADKIKRFFGCNIILGNNFVSEYPVTCKYQPDFEPHPNILPALCAIESKNYFLILHEGESYVTLKDCLTFTPNLINSNYTKPLFIIYQFLQAMKNVHEKGLIMGNLKLEDIYINDALFIQVIPNFQENICKMSDIDFETPENILNEPKEKLELCPTYGYCKPFSDFPSFPQDINLETVCNKWINRQISNFDYLMYLNHFAGRRFGDPSCHFVMPWVSDFKTRANGTWRDLSKSKFRLNKGDRQLDLTYEDVVNSSQVPHHVSDVLSEITYYVYLSRRTPQSLLRKHVRSVWVPAEYPSSIQRLQEWTPDECIPEFFYDPTIFKSIHEDLPDLELPHWALTPEEFIEAHKECLESKFVSERLHHWIDLTFGYKLSGPAAVKSKNVCLHLVENHRKLKTSGVVQLFSYPHPPRQVQILFFEKVPPKVLSNSSLRQAHISVSQYEKETTGSEDEGQSSGNGEDDSFGTKSSPLLFSKLLSRSKGSILASFQSSTSDDFLRSEQQKLVSTGVQNSSSNVSINISKEYNPCGLLSLVETNQNFYRKTFLTKSNFSSDSESKVKLSLKRIIANKKLQEMQILGCLIVEIFLQHKMRVVDVSDFNKRLIACSNILTHDNVPRCVRSCVKFLLQPLKDGQDSSYITPSGLPPPTAHQLLQPLLSSFMFPFPKLFPTLYSSVSNLRILSQVKAKLLLLNPQECQLCESLDILKIKKLSNDLRNIWDDLLSTTNEQIIELLFFFIKELFENPSTSKLSVILFLDKVSRSLGPRKTNELLLETILNLYNTKFYNSSENLYLYHNKFLLLLIVRCGLKIFLENFIAPLMEAVGSYKDSFHDRWNTKSSDIDDVESNEFESLHNEWMDASPEGEIKESVPVKEEREVEVFKFDQDEPMLSFDTDDTEPRAVEHLDIITSDGDQCSQEEEEYLPSNRQTTISPDKSEGKEKTCKAHLKNCQCNKEFDDQKKQNTFEELNFECHFSSTSELRASDIAGDSIVWLAHRLGPVLTSRYLVRNLLRLLSICFAGKDNLEPHKFTETDEAKSWKLSVLRWKVVGDENVENVLKVLGEISQLYGKQIILLQYLPFMAELINLSRKKFTLSLEGGIIGCLTLLKYIVPFMNDTVLMDQLQDVILKNIIHPTIRLVSSTRVVFPCGQRGRYTLVSKLIDCIYLISLRIGAEMTKVHIAVPALQRFFLTFDKAQGILHNCDNYSSASENSNSNIETLLGRMGNDSKGTEILKDDSIKEWSVNEVPGELISISQVQPNDSLGSSPGVELFKSTSQSKALVELKSVFDSHLAYQCYKTFCRFLGDKTMENFLKNHNSILELYKRYEEEQFTSSRKDGLPIQVTGEEFSEFHNFSFERGSFGSNVAVIGNKIEVQQCDDIGNLLPGLDGVIDSDVSALISNEIKDSGRHLRGNWLAYWEHEIGRSEKDSKFNFKQIKLQNFTGHTNSVRMIHCLENENSFMSGSKDKTVKLWSLRSQGDGSCSNKCQITYSHHRKSLLSLSFIPSVRLIASCDSIIHLWDPFEGRTVAVMDNARISPINVLKPLNPPSCNLVAATTDPLLKIVDTRLASFVCEFRVFINSVGLIRSICVSPNGNCIALGQASGLLTVLDIRTGMVLSSWKGHEAEVLQLAMVSDNVLMSSSLDQTVSAWNISDGKFKFFMKGPAEPVHCLSIYNSELITGTTANRIGVHTSIDDQASFSSTKLRSDAFKGILTSMTVLPLNRLLLLGADNGNITLLC